MRSTKYGYLDDELVVNRPIVGTKKIISFIFAILLICAVWFYLDQKLIFGEDWLSQTYDREDWRTNEGNLHTFGAWDLETHVWKTEYIMENFPNFHWNPYWYLGMPLLKYYQLGFYLVHAFFIILTGLSAAKTALLMIVFGHLIATLLTFVLCYKVSRRILVSALASIFLLSNTFLSIRSYGWEPITVVFMFIFPIGLMLYLREPMRPFRLSLILLLGLAYLAHPLIWFSLLMYMGVYLLLIALRKDKSNPEPNLYPLFGYVLLAICSMLIGAVQFFPQITYTQVTSGAHMGVKYLPFYQVPFNIISPIDFLSDTGNLKGPGPIIMIALVLLIYFAFADFLKNRNRTPKTPAKTKKSIYTNQIIGGTAIVLFLMVMFYYLELYNIFPMNILRSIQYHRIIPEFIITAALLVAAMSNIADTRLRKAFYYPLLIAFVLASGIIIYKVQLEWSTVDTISDRPEFIYDDIKGRISFPYTDQSLSVRSSFTKIPQTYGYYEQGITNPYLDEIFSVSSGFHAAEYTITYLKAVNVGRLYVNTEEGEKSKVLMQRVNGSLSPLIKQNERYSYFEIPLKDPGFAQALSYSRSREVAELEPECKREMYKEQYCGSAGEEFVTNDPVEYRYISAYVELLDEGDQATAEYEMIEPDHYNIHVTDADNDTAVIVKMTFDNDFSAVIDGKEISIEPFGPDFMLIWPNRSGDYTIELKYSFNTPAKVGLVVTILTIITLIIYFIFLPKRLKTDIHRFKRGDM